MKHNIEIAGVNDEFNLVFSSDTLINDCGAYRNNCQSVYLGKRRSLIVFSGHWNNGDDDIPCVENAINFLNSTDAVNAELNGDTPVIIFLNRAAHTDIFYTVIYDRRLYHSIRYGRWSDAVRKIAVYENDAFQKSGHSPQFKYAFIKNGVYEKHC